MLTIVLIAVAAAVPAVDLGEVAHAALRLDGTTLSAVLLLSLTNYALRFGRWHGYVRDLGHRVPLLRHLAIYVAGFALTPTPGKVGEGLRAFYLRPFGIRFGRAISLLYAERLLDVMAVSLLGALLCLAPVSGFRWLATLGGALVVVLLALQHPTVLAATRRALERLPRGRLRLGEAAMRITAFQHDVTALVRPGLLLPGLAVGLAAWLAEGFGLYLVAAAMGIDIGPLAAIAIYATAMLAGALSFVPGGLGSAEAAMAALLALAGAPLPAAIAATALIRAATLWFAVVLGAAAWLGLEVDRRMLATPHVREGRG
ncbi:MAG TPA: lysylphosphatidylglycerol synthase transmembrane domain-containing protein [Alphaproteobacteria bacterium]|nr:lysylphosphatidylglycerol synthase transmembrane domain-containing protein [Alphaproteobacteria bacterium]